MSISRLKGDLTSLSLSRLPEMSSKECELPLKALVYTSTSLSSFFSPPLPPLPSLTQ